MQQDRRNFLKNSALLPAALAAGASGASSPMNDAKVPDQLTVLFQGDSITDAGRDRESTQANDYGKMGVGYSLLASAMLLDHYPKSNIKYYNRGISGHKVFQLSDRWDKDALKLKPGVISILIGVNDFWHMLNGNYNGTVKTYRDDYRKLLKRTQEALPGVKLIICEPFIVRGGGAVKDRRWETEFPAYREAAREMHEAFNTAWVPFQRIFDDALEDAPAGHWSHDGVHPSLAGSYRMAEAWTEAFDRLY